MKRIIIESLTYPRMAMLSQMEAGLCPLDFNFDAAVPTCRTCEHSRECQWLTGHDEFQALTEKPIQDLCEAVLFCVDYVESRSVSGRHNIRYCACESCDWLRDAKYLTQQIREELTLV